MTSLRSIFSLSFSFGLIFFYTTDLEFLESSLHVVLVSSRPVSPLTFLLGLHHEVPDQGHTRPHPRRQRRNHGNETIALLCHVTAYLDCPPSQVLSAAHGEGDADSDPAGGPGADSVTPDSMPGGEGEAMTGEEQEMSDEERLQQLEVALGSFILNSKGLGSVLQ